MADNKKYYYLRLKENFFDSDDIIIIEGEKKGYLYINILLKLYLKSLKGEGRLMFTDAIPYDTKMIAKITRHTEKTVKEAIDIFAKFDLIQILSNGAIYMNDIQNFIGQASTEADRKREYDRKIQREKEEIAREKVGEISNFSQEHNKEMLEKCIPEIEIEKEIEKENRIDYQQIADMYNDTCVSFPKVTKLSESRKKAIRARLNLYTLEDFKKLFTMAEESDFLKGANNRNWSATFDWLIADSNMCKVLSGNYSNRTEKEHNTQEKGATNNNKFINFEQRTYDYDQLERELMGIDN